MTARPRNRRAAVRRSPGRAPSPGVQPGRPRGGRNQRHEPRPGGRAFEEDDLPAGRRQGEGLLEPGRKFADVNSRGHAVTSLHLDCTETRRARSTAAHAGRMGGRNQQDAQFFRRATADGSSRGPGQVLARNPGQSVPKRAFCLGCTRQLIFQKTRPRTPPSLPRCAGACRLKQGGEIPPCLRSLRLQSTPGPRQARGR